MKMSFCVPCDRYFRGAGIAESGVCPLCGTKFESYDTLRDFLAERERTRHAERSRAWDKAHPYGKYTVNRRVRLNRQENIDQAQCVTMISVERREEHANAQRYEDLSSLSFCGRRISDAYTEATGKHL